jgi:hypothetical protein
MSVWVLYSAEYFRHLDGMADLSDLAMLCQILVEGVYGCLPREFVEICLVSSAHPNRTPFQGAAILFKRFLFSVF